MLYNSSGLKACRMEVVPQGLRTSQAPTWVARAIDTLVFLYLNHQRCPPQAFQVWLGVGFLLVAVPQKPRHAISKPEQHTLLILQAFDNSVVDFEELELVTYLLGVTPAESVNYNVHLVVFFAAFRLC